MNTLINDTCPSIPTGTGAMNMFLTLINALFTAKCSLDQSSQYPKDSGPFINNGDTFDFIIIGSGAGGSPVGYELSEVEDWRVLVLEAGGLPSSDSEIPGLAVTLDNTYEDWQFPMEPNVNALLGMENNSNIWHRGKLLGGSTSINYMLYLRGQDVDFDEWAAMGNTGWDYESILPIYIDNENMTTAAMRTYYGDQGPQKLIWSHVPNDPLVNAFYETAPKMGLEVLPVEGIGFFETPATIFGGYRQNAAKSFLGSVKNKTNLFLAYNSYVEKIIVENKKTKGVIVNIAGRKMTLNVKKEVIVSGGSVNSPQLLLLSGIGPKDHLVNVGIEPLIDLPAVGKNLHDHAMHAGLYFKAASLKNYTTTTLDDIYNYLMYRNDTVYGVAGTKLGAFTSAKGSDIRQNQFFFFPNAINSVAPFLALFPFKEEYNNILITANQEYPLLGILFALVNPISRGQISLRNSDPYEKPKIELEYLQFEEEVEALLDGLKFLLDIISKEPLANLALELVDIPVEECLKNEKYSDEYWKCYIRYFTTVTLHFAGSCKMGNDSTAVVDSRLRVHGIDGLRVIDTSIMPQVTKGNTMAPTMMIGRKGGKMIREDWDAL